MDFQQSLVLCQVGLHPLWVTKNINQKSPPTRKSNSNDSPFNGHLGFSWKNLALAISFVFMLCLRTFQSCDHAIHNRSRLSANLGQGGEGTISLCSHHPRVSWFNQSHYPNGVIALFSRGRRVSLAYYGLSHDSAVREKSSMFQGYILHH